MDCNSECKNKNFPKCFEVQLSTLIESKLITDDVLRKVCCILICCCDLNIFLIKTTILVMFSFETQLCREKV